METHTKFKEWLRSKSPDIVEMVIVGMFLESVEYVVEITYHKSGTDTGEEVSKLLDYKMFKLDLIKGVLGWLVAYQKEFKSVPYEYTSRDNRRDWEHDKHGWSVAIRVAMKEFKKLKGEMVEC